MRTKKSLKVLVLALAVVMVFAVCSTAMAYQHTYSNLEGRVTGGDSQRMAYAPRTPNVTPSFRLDAAYATGNPGTWAMRGYNSYNKVVGMEATDLVYLDDGGIRYVFPLKAGAYSSISMFQSVTSAQMYDYFSFSGFLHF